MLCSMLSLLRESTLGLSTSSYLRSASSLKWVLSASEQIARIRIRRATGAHTRRWAAGTSYKWLLTTWSDTARLLAGLMHRAYVRVYILRPHWLRLLGMHRPCHRLGIDRARLLHGLLGTSHRLLLHTWSDDRRLSWLRFSFWSSLVCAQQLRQLAVVDH